MKMKWISVEKQPVPLDREIIVTDGEHKQFCKFHLEEYFSFHLEEYFAEIDGSRRKRIRHHFSTDLIGVFGYEYEAEVNYEQVTHWIDMGDLDLPAKGGI